MRRGDNEQKGAFQGYGKHDSNPVPERMKLVKEAQGRSYRFLLLPERRLW